MKPAASQMPSVIAEEMRCLSGETFSASELLYVAEDHPSRYQDWSLRSWWYTAAKRVFDLVLAFVLIPFLLPACLTLIVLIKCCSRGPVFYRHLRVGQNGRRFYLYKFRTMYVHDEGMFAEYLRANAEARREWDEQFKLRRDPRVTPVGAVLRRTSLDELPQIVNVLLGNMSFVGPRPIVHDEICRYGDAFSLYSSAKPGITGLWQVSGRGAISYQDRISLDVLYLTKWSFFLDVRILARTVRTVSDSRGAY